MNKLRTRVISQEKGMYKISSGTEIKTATVSGKYRYDVKTVSDYPAVGDYVIAEWPEDDYAADNSRYLEAKRAKFNEIAKINKSVRKNRC